MMSTAMDFSPSAFDESILAGARTVTTLADHLERLKQTAAQMKRSFGASQRGYFTPTEDEQVKHLVVSYWHSRSALFDLVDQLQHEFAQAEAPFERRQQVFLVGYGAAVLLVDAARSLREMFHRSSLVRAKLNEPVPQFAVPEGSYNTVQKSMTSPVNAWHLYHATRFFKRHRRQFKQIARGDPLMAELLEVIRHRGKRVRITVWRYLRARLRVRASQVMRGVREDAVGAAVYRLEKLAGTMMADQYVRLGHRPAVPNAVVDQLRGIIQPGDVLVVRKEHALTNYFLPGYWPHAALYVGDAASLQQMGLRDHEHVKPLWQRIIDTDAAEPRRVVEAMKDGVRIRSWRSPLASDAVVVIRPKLPRADIACAIGRAFAHEGKAYDFDFDFTRSDRLVCTELVYHSYEGIGGVQFELTRRAGRMTLSAEDLLRMALDRKRFEPLALFAPQYNKHLLTGTDADQVLRVTLNCV